MSHRSKGYFSRLFDLFRDSLIDERLEADLYPISEKSQNHDKGEIEFYRHTQGQKSIKVKINSDLDVPEGDKIYLFFNKVLYLEMKVTGKKLRHSLNTKEGDSIPELQAGDQIEIHHHGNPILQGQFEKD